MLGHWNTSRGRGRVCRSEEKGYQMGKKKGNGYKSMVFWLEDLCWKSSRIGEGKRVSAPRGNEGDRNGENDT